MFQRAHLLLLLLLILSLTTMVLFTSGSNGAHHQSNQQLSTKQANDDDDDDDDNDQLFYFYFPSYGTLNSDRERANLRFYGLVYKMRNSDFLTDIITKAFLSSDEIEELRRNATTEEEKANLERNLEPFLRWDLQSGEKVTVHIENWNLNVTMSDDTATDGRFDEFIDVNVRDVSENLLNDTTTTLFYRAVLPMVDSVSNNTLGNITLANTTSFGVVSDVDDVLRIVEIWKPKTALRKTFVEPYVVVPGMLQLFDIFRSNLTDVSFHYATTAVELNGPPYRDFLASTYPPGSLDMRPLDITDPGAILNARHDQLQRLRDTYPLKMFILIGDTSNSNAVTAFSQMARDYPDSVSCVFIRNITATYPDYSSRIDLEEEFKDVPNRKWFVFDAPEDLYDIDFASGSCRPPGVPEEQTTNSGGFGGTDTSGAPSITMTSISFCALIVPLLALASMF